jgi:hypothetical protein
VQKVVEVVQTRFGLTEKVGRGILRHLIEDGEGLSKFGLAQAVTAAANDEGLDYDTSTELQRLGGRVIELPAKDWSRISSAKGFDRKDIVDAEFSEVAARR